MLRLNPWVSAGQRIVEVQGMRTNGKAAIITALSKAANESRVALGLQVRHTVLRCWGCGRGPAPSDTDRDVG